MQQPKTFVGVRPNPPADYVEKGISNDGGKPDYEGVIFSDGTVVIRWLTQYRSHSVWQNWNDFFQVHGHPEYGTEIVYGVPGYQDDKTLARLTDLLSGYSHVCHPEEVVRDILNAGFLIREVNPPTED